MTTLHATSYGGPAAARARLPLGRIATLALLAFVLAMIAARGISAAAPQHTTAVGMLADPTHAPDDRPLLLPDR